MKIRKFHLLFLLPALVISCYRAPDDTIFVEDLDMVTTTYDENISYGTEYMTYYIADSFGLASNVKSYTIDDANDPAFVKLIRDAIADNMDNYGYVLTTDTPDVYIPVTITYINTKGVAYYPVYSPGYGYGYGYPYYGYGYGYGGYYYSWGYIPTTFSYDQGSVVIDMVDLKNRKAPIAPDTVWRVENVWNLAISGLIIDEADNDRNERLEAAIDKGFEQSSYLKK